MGRYDREEKLRLQLNIAIGELLYSLPIDLGGVLKGGIDFFYLLLPHTPYTLLSPPPHPMCPTPHPRALALGRAPITWGGGVGIMGMQKNSLLKDSLLKWACLQVYSSFLNVPSSSLNRPYVFIVPYCALLSLIYFLLSLICPSFVP